jgi:hypothetical protein
MGLQQTNYDVYRGDTFGLILTFKNNDIPQDITGWTLFFTLKTAVDDPDSSAILKIDWTTHTDPTNGISTLTLTATQTDALAGAYYYDIQTKNTSSTIQTILYGTMTFTKDITRRTTVTP